MRPFQAGFLVFSDFQRGPLRLSALMKLPVVHVYTHDSIAMGEDGPTHQPVEQLASLRAMPGLVDLRPADANEIREAWRVLLAHDRPPGGAGAQQAGHAGAWTGPGTRPPAAWRAAATCWPIRRAGSAPDAIIMASGSEVALAVDAYEDLSADGLPACAW